ncbi:MAG: protein BatD [Magnetococcales bacterium]|nr:protein BatD [Magnetococcales bacterium]
MVGEGRLDRRVGSGSAAGSAAGVWMGMIKPLGWIGLVALLIWMPALSWAGEITSRVDRTLIQEGDRFTLTLQSDDSDQLADLDQSPLQRDFEVLGSSTGSSIQIINGSMTSTASLTITLQPKRTGKFLIPALIAGSEITDPIAIEVTPLGASVGRAKELFMEMVVDEADPYVQGQVILTVRLYASVQILDGSIILPEVENLLAESLGDDRQVKTQVDGRSYRLLERRYALFPQMSGPLTLDGAMFEGAVAAKGRSRSRFSGLFGGDPFQSLTQRKQAVRLKSNSLTLNVRPRPPEARGRWWLPARQVTLSESWEPELGEVRVGEPVTRGIVLNATGLVATQLPELDAPKLDNIKIYPDRSADRTWPVGDWMVGERISKWAVVPETPGEVTLPEVRVAWWNTELDRQEEAVLPSRTLTVLPSLNGAGSKAQSTPLPRTHLPQPSPAGEGLDSAGALGDGTSENGLDGSGSVASPEGPSGWIEGISRAGYWPWLAGFFGFAWMVTLYLWRRDQSGQAGAQADKQSGRRMALQRARSAIKAAALKGDARQVRDDLLHWGRVAWPDDPPLSLGELARRLGGEGGALFQSLDRTLYGRGEGWEGPHFWAETAPLLKKISAKRDKVQPGLAPLHPEHS